MSVQEKVENSQQEKMTQILELQEEISQSRTREEHYRKYIRELEQKNDDLERSQRYLLCVIRHDLAGQSLFIMNALTNHVTYTSLQPTFMFINQFEIATYFFIK